MEGGIEGGREEGPLEDRTKVGCFRVEHRVGLHAINCKMIQHSRPISTYKGDATRPSQAQAAFGEVPPDDDDGRAIGQGRGTQQSQDLPLAIRRTQCRIIVEQAHGVRSNRDRRRGPRAIAIASSRFEITKIKCHLVPYQIEAPTHIHPGPGAAGSIDVVGHVLAAAFRSGEEAVVVFVGVGGGCMQHKEEEEEEEKPGQERRREGGHRRRLPGSLTARSHITLG